MSRWISKSAGYEVIADAGATEASRDQYGRTVAIPLKQPLVLKFQHERMLPAYERLLAVNHWMKSSRRHDGHVDSFGASPSMYGGEAIQDGTGRLVGVTEGLRPDDRFSVFDTDWLDPEQGAFADKVLRECDENGRMYVEVIPEQLPAPWPNYDAFTTARKIATTVADLGLDPLKVMAYERATKNRADVIEALAEAHTKLLADRAVNEALTVETP